MDFLKDTVSKAASAAQQQGGHSNQQSYSNSHSHSIHDSHLRTDQGPPHYGSNQQNSSFSDQFSQSERTSTSLQQQKGFGDHIVGFLDGGASERREEEDRLARAEEERKRRERESEGFMGKVKDMFDGGADADRKRREEERLQREQQGGGIPGKLTGLLGGGGAQSKPAGPKGFGDHINEAFGGGHKAEQKEDFLDKGIDAFQQHVLGQGPQHNESAFEQAKDSQIANFIRGATGMNKK